MKNRKKVLIAFVVCAALLMSVGYAALTTTLTLDGTAYIKTDKAQNDFAGNVKILSVAAESPLDTANRDTDEGLSATLVINSIGRAGETAKFTAVVESKSLFKVDLGIKHVIIDGKTLNLDENKSEANSEAFLISWSWDKTRLDEGDQTAQTATLTVEFKLLETPQTSHDHTFQIGINATSVE